MYMTSRCVHSVVELCFIIRPTTVPPSTPATVIIVRMLSFINLPNFDGILSPFTVCLGCEGARTRTCQQHSNFNNIKTAALCSAAQQGNRQIGHGGTRTLCDIPFVVLSWIVIDGPVICLGYSREVYEQGSRRQTRTSGQFFICKRDRFFQLTKRDEITA